jgi:hypothetical protein
MAATEKVAALNAVEATTTVISTKMRRDTVSGSAGCSSSGATYPSLESSPFCGE